MKKPPPLPRCSWCGQDIRTFVVPTCRKCKAKLCSPVLRDCALEHFEARHQRQEARV